MPALVHGDLVAVRASQWAFRRKSSLLFAAGKREGGSGAECILLRGAKNLLDRNTHSYTVD
jgi:hypothetical protein